MNQEFEDRLSPEERQALDRLAREQMPPPFLEERIVKTLKRSALLRSSGSVWQSKWPRMGLAVAASLLFFILGAMAAEMWLSKPAARTDAPEFLLVLREPPALAKPVSPEEERRIVTEYSNWARQLGEQGVLVDGEKLKTEARLLRLVNGRPVAAENPTDPQQETIGGYFLIAAQDYERAVKIAESCPHLKYGGTIEVRQIDRF